MGKRECAGPHLAALLVVSFLTGLIIILAVLFWLPGQLPAPAKCKGGTGVTLPSARRQKGQGHM